MNIRKKMMLIVIAGILFFALFGTVLVYEVVKQQVLMTEIVNLEKSTNKFNRVTVQRFSESEPKLKNLAKLLETQLEKSPQIGEIEAFNQLVERNTDGVWRNRKSSFNGLFEAGVFFPPEDIKTNSDKINYLRIKKTIDIFGAAAKNHMENVWYLSPKRGEIIFDKHFTNFVFEQKADNDYTQTPWVTYSTPQINPLKELRFTPPLFDPVPKIWMVSAIYPLYVHNKWIGSLGEDLPLTETLDFIFQDGLIYSGSEQFLIDGEDNFILAGTWQKELEKSSNKIKLNFENEPQLVKLFTKSLTHEPALLSDNLMLHNKRYVAIGSTLDVINWRSYTLVPVDEIMAPTQKLFLTILGMILFVGVLNGVLVFSIAGHTITNRIQALTVSMMEYIQNHSVRVAAKLRGKDEISQVAFAFDQMADNVEIQQVQLKESRDQFASLIANIPGITYRCALDKDWTMLFMSGLVEKLTGYPASDFTNNSVRTYASVIHPDDSEYVEIQVNQAVKRRIPFLMEYRIIDREGKTHWVHERGQAVYGTMGEIAFLDGFILDITDKHELEVELKRNEKTLAAHNSDLVQFTNIAAHHLQEPTRRIVSFVQQLENALSEEAKRNDIVSMSLQFIGQSAKRQRALVRDIQLYLAATNPRGQIEAINVKTVIQNVLEKYAAQIRDAKANIELGELPTIVIDKPRLFDVFNVLIENALFYRRLDVQLQIRICGEIQGNNVHYWVEDNGTGIPIEYRERVFLVFERLHINKDQDSTGIGLAILKRIIESCNGTVKLRETLNGGVTVEFDLPLSG